MYAPFSKAKSATSTYVLPEVYPMTFHASHKGVKPGYEGVGTMFEAQAAIEGSEARCYEQFLVPNDESDVEVFENRVSKNGNIYKDMNYEKFLKLQSVMGCDIHSEDDMLDMLATAHVKWKVNLEVSATSKNKDGDPVDNWDDIKGWFIEHVGKSAKFFERDGKEGVRWTIYNATDENTALVQEVQGIPNVYFRNSLSGFGKPTKV